MLLGGELDFLVQSHFLFFLFLGQSYRNNFSTQLYVVLCYRVPDIAVTALMHLMHSTDQSQEKLLIKSQQQHSLISIMLFFFFFSWSGLINCDECQGFLGFPDSDSRASLDQYLYGGLLGEVDMFSDDGVLFLFWCSAQMQDLLPFYPEDMPPLPREKLLSILCCSYFHSRAF